MLCHLWEASGDAEDGRVGSPSMLNLTFPANTRHRHVIRGIKLEFSSEALSPSGDLFRFRPPGKQFVRVTFWPGRGRNADKALDSLAGSNLHGIPVQVSA